MRKSVARRYNFEKRQKNTKLQYNRFVQFIPFTTKILHGEIILKENPLVYSHNPIRKFAVYTKGGIRIIKARFQQEKRLTGTEQTIIEQIHKARFGTDNPYVITGGHFSPLFVRNLGIFYNALLDPRLPSTDDDWLLRQQIALKTVAFDLSIFALAGKDFTTIYPVKKNIFTCYNVYTRPSDSLFAILYTLHALTDDTFIETLFPAKKMTKRKLQTSKAANKLLKDYRKVLQELITNYYTEIIDTKTGLIKKDILLASARDGLKRQSSFYDNVILWSTIRLANKLNLYQITQQELSLWKKRIIQAFWDEKHGIFLDDLSSFAKQEVLFSADSFIVLSTGFFTHANTSDMQFLKRIIAYVKKHKLDHPFPLHYSIMDLSKNLYGHVRRIAPTYMGTSIWSHWGMEYIKALLSISRGNDRYLADAKKHIGAYKRNIEYYGGYPEVYDRTGRLLTHHFYRSVLHNGWVINYEQVKMLYGQIVKENQ